MKPLTPTRYVGFILCGLAALALALVLSPGIGIHETGVGLREAWNAFQEPSRFPTPHTIAFQLRLPRTLLAVQAGITLGLCGAVFQVLFRNPLATPYTLGVSSGASLGALIAIKAGWDVVTYGISSVALCAFIGAAAVIGGVFLLARGLRRLTTTELLLAGVTLGLFCSAMMMFVMHLSTERQTFDMVRWMMGSVVTVGFRSSISQWPGLVVCWALLIMMSRPLNQYMLGEDIAATRGVAVARLQTVCILAASLATAIIVAQCGPIGFVGLVVPQMVGRVTGRDCRILLPMSALAGGIFLAVCDWGAQLAMSWAGAISGMTLSSATLPTGVVTAIIGVPIFLMLLYRRAK